MLSFLFLTVCNLGKSCFLTYILVLNLLAARPIFFQVVPGIAFLFCDRGVFSFDPARWKGHDGLQAPCEDLGLTLDRQDGPLFLVDSTAHIISPSRQVFVVQAGKYVSGLTCPIEEVYRFLKPWSWPEIAIGCVFISNNAKT